MQDYKLELGMGIKPIVDTCSSCRTYSGVYCPNEWTAKMVEKVFLVALIFSLLCIFFLGDNG